MTQARRLFIAVALLTATIAQARVISYAPYTNRSAQSAVQSRLNRHFVLIESAGSSQSVLPGGGIAAPFPHGSFPRQVVVYDFTGVEEPRVAYPPDGTIAEIHFAAVRENAQGVPAILIQTSVRSSGITNPVPSNRLLLSRNGGTTWTEVTGEPVPQLYVYDQYPDVGGPIAASRYSPVRIGNDATPFVLAAGGKLFAISNAGVASILFEPAPVLGMPEQALKVVGTDVTGSQFLVQTSTALFVVSAGQSRQIATVAGTIEGWITPVGDVYVDIRSDKMRLAFIDRSGAVSILLEDPSRSSFAIPTFHFSGAWIIDRGPGKPTTLYGNANVNCVQAPCPPLLEKQWEDITSPEVEALHAGSSGNSLLIQVHRERPQADQRLFLDPALAVWRVGQAAPRVYDELFMNEQINKRFIHVDVEKIEAGEPFVFDSGTQFIMSGNVSPSPSPSAGGGDVIQEWGVVRASLKQQLVLPAVGRTPGAYGSFWITDVIFHNPSSAPQRVDLRFLPNGERVIAGATNATITLQPNEIRRVEDVLPALFKLDSGTGALFITPESGVNVTSRTYSRASNGTFGFGMNAIDVFAAAASPRFPVSFAGAFPGPNFRTNLVVTDTSSRGTVAALMATSTNGVTGLSNLALEATANGQQQFNNINVALGLGSTEAGALVVRPTRGSAVASVFAVDNVTNDSTYFPPDLPAPFVRTIPVIGHVDGANASRFRSDLYLYNSSSTARGVTLQMTPWDNPAASQTLNLTLVPNEARVIRDVLFTLFGREGLARLRYSSPGDAAGVRVTSRTYSLDDKGGSYGFLMPPLNNFQSGGSGDTLEILGAVADGNYRTNIGLVELSAFQGGASSNVRVEIVDSTGRSADSFTINIPTASGRQINDIFRSRNLNVTGPVLIRVTPLSGMVGAYSTMTDNRTNDSIYLAANLAAQE
jgi:hypothetical protein